MEKARMALKKGEGEFCWQNGFLVLQASAGYFVTIALRS
jgi:hypothetical protein